ncbi:MAG: hypothetical protein HUJ68_03125 [Clostridia bacterium]|nr:hypothetical protein [Clostridia bacterium]
MQSTLAVGTKYYFASASSTFDNATFQEMLLANGAYKIEDIGSDSTLHYTLATVSPMGMGPFTVPSIQPANSGAHNLKLKVTLNNSKGEAGDTYEVSCAVTVSA